jgi:hypothetical protein
MRQARKQQETGSKQRVSDELVSLSYSTLRQRDYRDIYSAINEASANEANSLVVR